MKAFITGSRAYGKPTTKSDIDLVILCDAETKALLQRYSESETTIRFGKLNVVTCETDEQYAVWKVGTEELKNRAEENGVRSGCAEATELLDELRERVGIGGESSYAPGENGKVTPHASRRPRP